MTVGKPSSMEPNPTQPSFASSAQDSQYAEVVAEFGGALARLTNAYEADPDHRRDLLQEVHLALWQSLASFDQRCSLRTWVYRIAHNTALTHVTRNRRLRLRTSYTLDTIGDIADLHDIETETGQNQALRRLHHLIGLIQSPDRQVILLYLEDLDAESIAAITGLTSGHVATKIHRIKTLLTRQFHSEEFSHA
jgi:RNA polymerase sigma-70 factor (ECF subfamily)